MRRRIPDIAGKVPPSYPLTLLSADLLADENDATVRILNVELPHPVVTVEGLTDAEMFSEGFQKNVSLALTVADEIKPVARWLADRCGNGAGRGAMR